MRPAYKQSKKDWHYLEAQAHLSDQVEEVGWFEELLEEPTKAKATELYHLRIEQWFNERISGRSNHWGADTKKPKKLDARTRKIADRHLCEI